ncbi:MAG: hypothetical protein Q8Q54_14860 [Methylococcales bacterium]|nr:hypothetical protein [Methylococcales bacterium]MDP3840197.1 hypothetical protein [Methylococcales bacterium]
MMEQELVELEVIRAEKAAGWMIFLWCKMLGFIAGSLGCGFLQPNKHDEQITFAIIIVRDCVGLPKRRQPNLRRLKSGQPFDLNYTV